MMLSQREIAEVERGIDEYEFFTIRTSILKELLGDYKKHNPPNEEAVKKKARMDTFISPARKPNGGTDD